MYNGYDKLSWLQILFVYFLALSSLLHPSIFFNYLFLIALRVIHDAMPPSWLVLWSQKRLGMRLCTYTTVTWYSLPFHCKWNYNFKFFFLDQPPIHLLILTPTIQYGEAHTAILWVRQSWLYTGMRGEIHDSCGGVHYSYCSCLQTLAQWLEHIEGIHLVPQMHSTRLE